MNQPPSQPVLIPGMFVGSYQIVGLLGVGGMGEVYRARDTKLNRDIALKVLPQAFAFDPDRLARFKREAQVLAALNHPNIAAIYGLEESGGALALVLELVDGPTLADRIALGLIPPDEGLAIAREIARALEAAHEKGVIHRDLKPANIKIAGNGAVKVLDFGLAKIWDGAPDADLSQLPTMLASRVGEGMILGTPAYMSPEQARGRTLDKRTDIWSFGCVLFEMLAGRAAFAGETISDTIARILEREPDWPSLPTSTGARVRDLLRRCLNKDRDQRLHDVADARIELDDAFRTAADSTAEWASEAAVTKRQEAARRRRLQVFVTGVFVVVAVLAWTFLARRDGGAALPTFRQLTFRHGTIRGARLAPDGQTVVYSATWIGSPPELYIIRPENAQSRSMPDLASAGIFSVSSRGDLAVGLNCRLNWGECIGTLAQAPMTGGSPREMWKNVYGADWSPDGQSLAIASLTDDGYQLEYPIGNVLYKTDGWITYARVSPQGDRLAFLDHPLLGDIGGSVSVLDLKGKKKTTVSSGWKSLQGLAWSSRGDEIWFTGSRSGKGGSTVLYAVMPSGQERTVFSSPGTLRLNDISRDGRQVLLTRGTKRGEIISGADGTKERELSWFDYSTVADLSSNGKTLLFYEWGEGVGAKSTIFIRKTDGSDAILLGEGQPLALSPDGLWVAAVQENAQRENAQLVLLPTRTGEAKPMPRGAIVEYLDWVAWSPDGRRIFFAGRESADVRHTYVQDVDGGDPRPVTKEGYLGRLLSPNGRMIATVDRYGEYYLCSVDEGIEPRPLKGYSEGDSLLQWSEDGRFLFVREEGNLVLRIYKLDLSTGDRQFWKEFVPPTNPAVLTDIGTDPGQVRITPDGKSYAYTYWTFEGELYLAQGLK